MHIAICETSLNLWASHTEFDDAQIRQFKASQGVRFGGEESRDIVICQFFPDPFKNRVGTAKDIHRHRKWPGIF